MEELPTSRPRPALSAMVGVIGILLGLVAIRTGFTITIDDFVVHSLPVGIAGCVSVLVGIIALVIWLIHVLIERRNSAPTRNTVS